MEEERLTALEQRIQADLATGWHRELRGGLGLLVAAYPFREPYAPAHRVALGHRRYRDGTRAWRCQTRIE
jgi:Bacterial transcriptional activator domain